jgi:hypothetical protein
MQRPLPGLSSPPPNPVRDAGSRTQPQRALASKRPMRLSKTNASVHGPPCLAAQRQAGTETPYISAGRWPRADARDREPPRSGLAPFGSTSAPWRFRQSRRRSITSLRGAAYDAVLAARQHLTRRKTQPYRLVVPRDLPALPGSTWPKQKKGGAVRHRRV